jgi:serine/threonine-protein kinase RsbT
MTLGALPSAAEVELRIERSTSVAYVQSNVRAFARRVRCASRDEWNLASEAATNVIKFATTGRLTLRLDVDPAPAVVLVVEDDGPGIPNVTLAMMDHFSEGVDLRSLEHRVEHRGLGTGLGAIRRLLTTLVIENRVEGGARLTGTLAYVPVP